MTTRQRAEAGNEGRAPSPSRVATALCLALASSSLALSSSCGAPCRSIETRKLDLECAQSSSFTGELHFDSEAPFDTFLRQQCLSEGDGAVADRVLASVDFATEAVFIARGRHLIDDSRCLESRTLDDAQVCSTGLKLYFQDEERAVDTCPGTRWTVAFVLPREELRAALAAAP